MYRNLLHRGGASEFKFSPDTSRRIGFKLVLRKDGSTQYENASSVPMQTTAEVLLLCESVGIGIRYQKETSRRRVSIRRDNHRAVCGPLGALSRAAPP